MQESMGLWDNWSECLDLRRSQKEREWWVTGLSIVQTIRETKTEKVAAKRGSHSTDSRATHSMELEQLS